MTMFFAKKLNKKGFTLAELLIVIAIIAILVAIAVPLFTSELNKAKIARDKANIRSVKAAAVAIILDDSNAADVNLSSGTWYAIGTFDSDSNLTDVTVSTTSADESEAGSIAYPGTVVVKIETSDLDYTIG